MRLLIILVGLPGSGKSYWANHINFRATIVSTDAIRAELTGNEEDQSRNNEVFAIARKRVREGLKKDVIVIFDATNLSKRDRKPFIDIGNECGALVHGVYFIRDEKASMRAMIERGRVVPTNVIERMKKKLQIPSKEEGFFSVNTVLNGAGVEPYGSDVDDKRGETKVIFDEVL